MILRRSNALAAGLLVLLLTACGGLTAADRDEELAAMGLGHGPSATGDVQIVWMGGGMGGEAPTEAAKLAYTDIAWFDAYKKKGDRGQFHYLVYSADGTLHREIVAEVPAEHDGTGVVIDGATAYFVGEVTYDSKGSAGGHDGGTGGEPGMPGEGEHEEEEGGCSGSHEDEGSGGPAHPPGSTSRVGQIVAVIVNDAGTPGANGDTLTWSWFADPSPEHPTYRPPPSIDDLEGWPELCEKPILEGNLVVHD